MRTRWSSAGALGLVLAVMGSAVLPWSAAAAAPTVTVTASIDSITCNPGGNAGLRVVASAEATGGSILGATLYAGEFRTIGAPYSPFPWGGMTVGNWQSEDAYRRGVTTDARTLDTTDRSSWNRGSYANGIWSASAADAWWIVSYWVRPSGRVNAETQVARYVNCGVSPATIIDAASLTPITFTSTTGDR